MKKHKTMKIKETNHSAGETKIQEQSLEKKINTSINIFISVCPPLSLTLYDTIILPHVRYEKFFLTQSTTIMYYTFYYSTLLSSPYRQYTTILYSTVLYSQYTTILYSTVLYSQYTTILYSTVLYCIVL